MYILKTQSFLKPYQLCFAQISLHWTSNKTSWTFTDTRSYLQVHLWPAVPQQHYAAFSLYVVIQPRATPLVLKIPLYTNNREVYSLRTLPSVCVSWIAQLCMTEQHRKHLLMLECRSPDRAGMIVLGMPLLQNNPAWIRLNLLPPASGLKSVVWPVKEQESHYLSEELRTMMTMCYSSDVRHILPENNLQNFPTYGCKNFFLISFSTPKGGTQAGCESCCNTYLRNVYATLRSMSTKAIT